MSKHIGVIILLVLINTSIFSNTYTVVNTLNTGPGSLRQAITDANTNMMGPNSIVFNISSGDLNYNAATGVFTITVLTELPPVQSFSTVIDGTTQPGNTNPYGPEICLNSNSNLYYGLCFPLTSAAVKGLIIEGFQMGIFITKYLNYGGNCLVSDCYIGVNYNGTSAITNNIGIAVYGGTNNSIKDNLISGNITAGIGIRNSNSNIIQGNKIGTDRTGFFKIPNYYGIAIDSSSNNLVGGNTALQGNLISGNLYAGIAINTNVSHDNLIKGNYIGTNLNCSVRSDTISNYYGIAINESYNNTIGGSTATERNIISGNSESGIAIMGSSSKNNTIQGNYIGTNASGSDSIPNSNGILLSGASNNIIGGSTVSERNIISGNKLAGIAMAYSGTRNNIVAGNYIGVDYQGTQILSNYAGVFIKSNANSNIIGGSTAGKRNIISGNYEIGVAIETADSNIIIGNYIGPDVSGLNALKLSNDTLIQANGLLFNSNAKHNIAGGYSPGERNVISGNRIYGHDIYGNSSYNYTIGNYIGVDASGNVAMPNATGVCVDGGSNHNPFINNVFSGNKAYGIFIVTTGTGYNELKGNILGLNAAGTDTVPNQSGLLLGGGTKYNIIGGTNNADRNIISGNRFDGILVSDTTTTNNEITGNYIGTDITGTLAKPNNIGIGIATMSSKNNVKNNLISGNKYMGLILFENADSNTVSNNNIGVLSNGIDSAGNGTAGIAIVQGSSNNIIGPGNIIAYNDTTGIFIDDDNTLYNTFTQNSVYKNGLSQIDIFPPGPNPNDPGDPDNGPNLKMNYPDIFSTGYSPTNGLTFITGIMDYNYENPSGIIVEVFCSYTDSAGTGKCMKYLGSTAVDSTGNWVFFANNIEPGDSIATTATDIYGNTSEISPDFFVITGIDEIITGNETIELYPNPAREEFCIKTVIKKAENIKLSLYDINGFKLRDLILENASVGINNYCFSTEDLASGLYFIISETGCSKIVSKLTIIR